MAALKSALWQQGISLIPYPQRVTLGGPAFVFPNTVALVLDADASEANHFAAKDLVGRLAAWGIEAAIGDAAQSTHTIIMTRKQSPLPNAHGYPSYELTVNAASITIAAHSEAGLFYGIRTLLQLIQRDKRGPTIAGLHIQDWPDIPYRAAHYDTKHHQDKADYVKRFIRQLADYKINILVWEWEDKFAYRSHPEIGAPGAFTMTEMQTFTRYAQQYHIQLVPLVQGLGHVSYILKWPQHAHLREIPASNWEFCPLKDGSYDLLLDLWREAIEATPGSEFLHIGTDETYELGLGEACGCRAKADEIGKRGLLLHFLQRCVDGLAEHNRRIISWGGEYLPSATQQPPAGLIVAEFNDDLALAQQSKHAGYPAWIYDPNPGIEHLFLPYLYRERRGEKVKSCLQASHTRVSTAAQSGLFEGMINTSWDDSGLHNQVWMMSFVNSAEWSWSGSAPTLDEFIEKFFASYYGPAAQDMRELWLLLNQGGYYYMDTFERKVWHWGDVGKTHLPDLPRGDAVEYDPFWNREYADLVERSRFQFDQMQRTADICRANLTRDVKNAHDFEVFLTIADLIAHTARTYLTLSDVEHTITRAHKQHFVSHQASYQAMVQAAELIQTNLDEREQVFQSLVKVWEKTRLPKGLSTPERSFFHQQDRARHFAFRRPDMSYLIYDEQLLGLETYLTHLNEYIHWYKQTYLEP